MATQAGGGQIQAGAQPAQWGFVTRVAFRFCFLYFGLLCLASQIITGLIPLEGLEIPDLSMVWPLRPLVFWTAAHVFQVKTELVYMGSGSGDKTFDWVLAFCLLVIGALGAGVWTQADRRRTNYIALYKWFRLFIRLCLAGQMFAYGLAKVIPLQMPYPFLNRLVEPFGNFSPMGVLWSSIGAAPAYEIFAGCAEALGGVLLIIPRTALLGALVTVADLIQVFLLNMTYDVPVKLFSFHLILMTILLIAPECSRLAGVLVLDRPVGPSTQPELFRTGRANRIAAAAQILLGVWLAGSNTFSNWSSWHSYGEGRTKSALYGIWMVDQMSIDGQFRPPLATDTERWRRLIFDFIDRAYFQRMDDSMARYSAKIDASGKTLTLAKSDDKNWKADFSFERPGLGQLTLDGEMDSHAIHMDLRLFDRSQFLLVNRGFHWVQEYPFNR